MTVMRRSTTRRGLIPSLRVRSRAGFTLAEVMVAIVVFALGLLGAAGLMSSSIRRHRLAASRGEMALLAESKVDELRAIGMTPLGDALRTKLALGGSTTTSVNTYADSTVNSDGRWYRRRWQIAADPTGARRVTMAVQPLATGNYQWTRLEFTTLVAF